jgi:hypothetical protein
MIFTPAPLLKGTVAAFTVDGADFDGSDYLSKASNLTGIANSKTGILSFWFRMDGDAANQYILQAEDVPADVEQIYCYWDSDESLYVGLGSVAFGAIALFRTLSSFTASADWHHFLAAWDTNAGTYQLYIDDAADVDIVTANNQTVDYTETTQWHVGSFNGGSDRWDGCLAELYFAPGQFLDITNISNRRRFISAVGKPVSLSSDGAGPTGTAPKIYLHLDDAEAVANFATNRSGAGNFTVNGTLATASTSPSD